MSRVLRRPMFRGGYVDSEGSGITFGLDTPKRGLVDSPGGYAGEDRSDITIEDIYDPSTFTGQTKRLVTNINEILLNQVGIPAVNLPGFVSNYLFGTKFKQIPGGAFSKGNVFNEYVDLFQNIIDKLPEEEIAKIRAEKEKKKIVDITKNTEKDNLNLQKEEFESNLDNIPTLSNKLNLNNVQTKSDFRTVYEDLLPLFKKELGASEDEFTRQKYLELAKFGLNLLRQPGGPPGGERNLLGAIAASAEKPLEGYQDILAKEKQAEKLPKALALEAAMKEAEPGSIGKSVKDLMKLGLSKTQAIEIASQTGSATREQTRESVIRNIEEALLNSNIVTDAMAARGAARELFKAEQEYGVEGNQFKKFPNAEMIKKGETPIEGEYYINEKGQSGRYYINTKNQPMLIKPGEKGFTGFLPK